MLSENNDIEDTFVDYKKSENRKYMVAALLTFAVLAGLTIYGIGQMAVV